MVKILSNGMADYETMTDVLHSLNEQTDVSALKQTVARHSEYGVLLAQRLQEQTAAGVVQDAVLDHIHVNAELLSRAVGRLYRLKAVEVTL